jgi:quercetin dioxygenase-like cupin family protein
MIEGTVALVVDGSEYNVKEGDLALVPANSEHEWKSNSARRAAWLVFNPIKTES